MSSRSFAPLFAAFAVVVSMLAVAVTPVRAEDSVPGLPDATITLRNGLSDRDVSVPLGGIVRFVNRDDERHRMRSRSGGEFDTGNLEPGESVQVRLSTSGTYTYIDEREDGDARYHGRIRVAGAGVGMAGGGTAGGGTAGGGVPSATATVTIVDEAFSPGATTINVGGTVTFENLDGDEHTATSAGTGGIDSGVLATGASYRKTFAEAGTFAFLCIFHPDMRGTIDVVGASAPTNPDPNPATEPTPKPTPAAPATGTAAVDIVDLAFQPASVEVTAGGSVTWSNTGVAPHTVTAEDGSFDSKTLESGGSFTQTFTTPGTVNYLCQIHPDMTGTIEVIAASAGAAGQRAEPAAAAPAAAAPLGSAPPDDIATTTALEPTSAHGPDPGPLGGMVLAVTLVSVAVALFARVVAGTARRVEE